MTRLKQQQEQATQLSYAEAKRYTGNAEETLQRAGKEDNRYGNNSYVRTAGGTARLGALKASRACAPSTHFLGVSSYKNLVIKKMYSFCKPNTKMKTQNYIYAEDFVIFYENVLLSPPPPHYLTQGVIV
jgi:hypothetical protein